MQSNLHFIYTVTVLIWSMVSTSDGLYQNCSELYLLNVEPYPYRGKSTAFWDRGLDLIPAGHLAAEQINNRSDVLHGYKLKLLDIDSEACGKFNVITKGVVNTFREIVDPNRRPCILGVVGLLCSPVTDKISPIVSHPKTGGFVQIAASTSPVHRARNQTQSILFHIIGSSSVFNEATFALMQAFHWSRISIIYNSVRFYQRSIAEDFMDKVKKLAETELVTHVSLTDSPSTFPKTFKLINEQEARISYWTVDYKLSAHLLCEAFHNNFLWPGYVYIIEELKMGKMLNIKTSCSREEIIQAMEGVFTLQYRLFVDNNTQLYSGLTYGEYRQEYSNKLRKFADERPGLDIKENIFANSLYDQVWAFGLAINSSLSLINSQRQPPGNGHAGSEMSNILRDELRKLSFQGASGRINFGRRQESPSYVDIFQIHNGTEEFVGTYDPFTNNITFGNTPTGIPRDTFETVYKRMLYWLGGCILIAQGVLFCLITTNCVLILKWRKEREIKATSPILSSLMMVGCYILWLEPIVLVAYRTLEIENRDLIAALCILKTWISVGKELIIGTMFLRLLRIYRIFCTAPMTTMSKYWVDKYLFAYVLLICSGKLFILTLWSSIHPIHPVTNPTYVHEPDKLPHYVATVRCICKTTRSTIWLLITFLYSAFLLLMVVFMAIRTRRVKKAVYKDTKKVNIYIFLITLCLATTIPLWIFFLQTSIEVGADVTDWLCWYSIPMLCQVCLFVPKTLPVVVRKVKMLTSTKLKLTCMVCAIKHLSSCN